MPSRNVSRRSFSRPLTKLLIGCLLLVSSGCSGMFSGQSEYEQVKQVEQQFSDLIAEAGGTATKEGRAMHGFQAAGWMIDLSGSTVSGELIDAIIETAQKDPVFKLDLSKSTVTDDQLARLDSGKALQKTFVLDLSDTAITDAGLDQISNAHCIGELKLKGSRATEQAAKRLGERKVASPLTPKPLKTPPKIEI